MNEKVKQVLNQIFGLMNIVWCRFQNYDKFVTLCKRGLRRGGEG